MSETILRRARFQLKNYDDSPVNIEIILKEKSKGLRYFLLDELRRWSLTITRKEYDNGSLEENNKHKSLSSDNLEGANLEFVNECLNYYVQELHDEMRDNRDSIPKLLYSNDGGGGSFIDFIPEKKEFLYSLFIADNSSQYKPNCSQALYFKNNVDWIQRTTGIKIDLSLSSSECKNALEWRLTNNTAILYRHIVEEIRRTGCYHIIKTDTIYRYPSPMELLHCILSLNDYPYRPKIADNAEITDSYYSSYLKSKYAYQSPY